ncbi:MAG: hypothetical protein HOP19_08750 [Acidobacteria bacterium]|nr:hypothetical protein [Acidobacteriota bacterium]
MSYNIHLTQSFKQSVKRLGKRYRHVKDDVSKVIESLAHTPTAGALIPGSAGVRKLRVNNSDMAKGKSSGYRLLYLMSDSPDSKLYLLLLYAKSDQTDVTKRDLDELIEALKTETAVTDTQGDAPSEGSPTITKTPE